MRKHRLQDIALGMLLMALVMGLAIPALAAVGGKTLDVAYMDIKLVVDGAPITPTDVNGNIVEPFAYQGTTYLPVRAVGEALGKEVTWDGNTNTVYVGEVPAGAIKNWVGVRNLVADLGTTLLGYAKDLPHIAKAIEETNARVYTEETGYLMVRPADAVTSTAIYLSSHLVNGQDELWIAGLQDYLGDWTWGKYKNQGYKTVVRAILEDTISDSSDIESIMNLIEQGDAAWLAFDKSTTAAEEAAARKRLDELGKVYEFNTVVVDWTEDVMVSSLGILRYRSK